MAIFRKGVKLGKGGMNDVRVSLLSKQRAKGLLRKAKIIDDGRGRKKFEIDARGDVTMYRKAVGQAEGFQFPVNFKIEFKPPLGISHPSYQGTEEKNPKEKDIIYEKEQPRNANNKLIVIAGLIVSAIDITNSTSFSAGALIAIIANFL